MKILWMANAAMLVALVALPAHAAGESDLHTPAAVLAIDQEWTNAEIRGDGDFVDALLLPEYRSIGASGRITLKEAIVSGARSRGPHSDFGKMVADYKANHPTRGDVAISGDTAILTWTSLVSGKGEPVASCDIFVYRDGHWRGLYSQHSSAEI